MFIEIHLIILYIILYHFMFAAAIIACLIVRFKMKLFKAIEAKAEAINDLRAADAELIAKQEAYINKQDAFIAKQTAVIQEQKKLLDFLDGKTNAERGKIDA